MSMTRPAWWYQPGELYDCKGRPIYPGDLLRTFHFRGCQNTNHYLYHVAVFVRDAATEHGYMRMETVSNLEPTRKSEGGCPMLSPDLAAGCEIVSGVTVGEWICFHDRPKRAAAAAEASRG